jgi:hypothetical protein
MDRGRIDMLIINAYLDTSIVSGLAKEDLKEEELDALLGILKQHKQGNVLLVTSKIVQDEINKIPEAYRRRHEIIYNLLMGVPVATEFKIYTGGGLSLGLGLSLGGGGKIPHPKYTELCKLLPDKADAMHIFQATMNNVQFFLTTDRRTILAYKEEITRISQVKAVNPMEFLKIVRTE